MKTIKTKKVFLAVFLNGLAGIRTKELQNIDEIEQFCELKKEIEEILPKYTKLLKDKQDFARQVRSEQIKDDEIQEKSNELNKRAQKLDTKSRDEKVKLELEDSDFNLFFDLFSRKGKDFFQSPENFVEFKKDLNEANRQSKKSNK